MSFKFCLDNEIHACSHAPQSLEALLPFLQVMFRDTLPPNPSFYYLNDESHKVYIKTEEDYQKLFTLDSSRKIKFYIIPHDKVSQFSGDVESVEIVDVNELSLESSSSNEYEVMEKAAHHPENTTEEEFRLPEAPEQPQESPIEKIEERSQSDNDNDNDEYEKIQEIQDHHESLSGEGENQATLSTTESRAYSPEKNCSEFTEEQEARFKELIRETIKQEIPYIISEVSKTLARKESVDMGVQCCKCAEQKHQQVQVVQEVQQEVHIPVPVKKEKKVKKDKNNKFVEGLKKIGQFFKNGFIEISDIGAELFDDISLFIEGDPIMLYSGGKFPSSYVEKAKSIAVIYPDANLHEVMAFIKKHPKRFTVDQVTELYIMKELQEAESATTRQSNQSCAF